jgi:8-oxo-dGTP pyrophosphatase MutT (NUDIX family)
MCPACYDPCGRAEEILVLHDGIAYRVLPGDRRESGESVGETLSREVLEETGYTVRSTLLLGFMHFHHLGPKPDGYAYPYPDFLQLVFVAQAGEFRPDHMVEDPFVQRSEMMRVADVVALLLSPGERVYLTVALEGRR